MKICKSCKCEKHESEFYRNHRMRDGFESTCKACKIDQARVYREQNLERVQAYDRSRSGDPKRVAARKAYKATDAFRQSHAAANRRYRDRHPDRAVAKNAVNNALRDGRIEKLPCLICGELEVEAHHPDYSRPLDVIWMCVKDHHELHEAHERMLRDNLYSTGRTQ